MNVCECCGGEAAGTTCTSCRSSRYYWKSRTPRQRIKRRERLELFRSRFDHFFAGDVKKEKSK
jgi:hypothetical protein